MSIIDKQAIESEMEYRKWRESPLWYCVKTTMHNNGKMESEIMIDEKTKMPIAIQDISKPLDGVFETSKATTYYTYHQGYKEAEKQLLLANA